MRKKIYFIIYSVLQMIMGIVNFVNYQEYADALYKSVQDALSVMPEAAGMFTIESAISMSLFSAGICTSFAIIFLVLALLDKVIDKKKLSLFLVIASLLMCNDDITFILAFATFLVILFSKKTNKKEKKEMKKLGKLTVTSNDRILSVVLFILYSTQFIIGLLPLSGMISIITIISYYLIVFGFSIYVFRKRFVRDFDFVSRDFSTYFKYIFKMWAVMIGFSLIAAFIRIVLGSDSLSANQTSLNDAPLWYVVPLAMIWAPIVEECLFRGSIRRFISDDKVFIIVSAISFGLLHTIGQEVGVYNTILQSLQYMAMGGVMAYTYTKTNNIFTNMGIHFIQNTFASIMMIFFM